MDNPLAVLLSEKAVRVVAILLLLASLANLGFLVYEQTRWQKRDEQFMENRRRIERLESLLLERR